MALDLGDGPATCQLAGMVAIDRFAILARSSAVFAALGLVLGYEYFASPATNSGEFTPLVLFARRG